MTPAWTKRCLPGRRASQRAGLRLTPQGSGFRVQGLGVQGLGAWGSGLRVQDLGFRVQGLGAYGSGFSGVDSGFRVQGPWFKGLEFRVYGLRVHGLGVWGSGFRIKGLGFRVQGLRAAAKLRKGLPCVGRCCLRSLAACTSASAARPNTVRVFRQSRQPELLVHLRAGCQT